MFGLGVYFQVGRLSRSLIMMNKEMMNLKTVAIFCKDSKVFLSIENYYY